MTEQHEMAARAGAGQARRGFVRRVLSVLPQGHLLPADAWRRRHRGIVVVLWLHAVGLVAAGLLSDYPLGHVLLEASAVAGAAGFASMPGAGRRLRSLAAAAGLVTSSALLVHFWGGTIEAHFHFFVVIPILALYQDWAPFLFALCYVVVHHGVMGAIEPGSVFNHEAALAHPWRWAFIHAVFVLGASAACLVSWRGNEQLLHEPLTGLPGRAVFIHSIEQALARLRRDRATLAVLFIDLDRFKLFNDTLGHAFGDALLVAAAERLRGAVRRGDVVARLGGDEFGILGRGLGGEADVLELGERVRAALDDPFLIGGSEVVAGASVGVAFTDSPRAHAGALLADADAAMYRAKTTPAQSLIVFDESFREQDRRRLATELALRHALARGEFRLVYQPIVAVGDGAIVGVETLLRWDHPDRGAVSPTEFIPLAEQTGLIVPIGAWVLREACRQAALWPACYRGGRPPYVSVNVSARQIAQPDFVAMVAETLVATGLEPHRLGLEITESLVLDEARAPIAALAALRELGVRLLLDDFGTGYSSLAYLQRLPVDTLKVDRAFLGTIHEQRQTPGILAAVASLGSALGMHVVAEGVETAEELGLVSRLGYGLAQGYHIARPGPVEDLHALLMPDRATPGREVAAHAVPGT